jgi:enterochelin esterase-like enzyme
MRAQCVLTALCCVALNSAHASDKGTPLVIGETFTLQSKVLSETRRINVYLPPGYAEAPDARFPVLYMPDGGLAEDFLHVAGLVQVSVGNGTMRPFVLVGIENTQRRRDLTGPTQNEEDKKIAPHVGGSAAFRRFLRDELMPTSRRAIARRMRPGSSGSPSPDSSWSKRFCSSPTSSILTSQSIQACGGTMAPW